MRNRCVTSPLPFVPSFNDLLQDQAAVARQAIRVGLLTEVPQIRATLACMYPAAVGLSLSVLNLDVLLQLHCYYSASPQTPRHSTASSVDRWLLPLRRVPRLRLLLGHLTCLPFLSTNSKRSLILAACWTRLGHRRRSWRPLSSRASFRCGAPLAGGCQALVALPSLSLLFQLWQLGRRGSGGCGRGHLHFGTCPNISLL
jgi:hypothetical protein